MKNKNKKKKKNVSIETYIRLVIDYHPKAECKLREFGKEYYHIIDTTAVHSILGVGKTKLEAWRAAYRNVYDHR